MSTEAPGRPANDPGLDLIGGVLSGTRSVLNLSIKVSDLGAGVQLGRVWQFNFGSSQRASAYYRVVASEQADGDAFAIYGPGTSQSQPALAQISGSVDVATNTINMSVPLHLLVRASSEFDTFAADSSRSVGTSGALLSNGPAGNSAAGQPESTDVVSDVARGQRTFVAGRGCGAPSPST